MFVRDVNDNRVVVIVDFHHLAYRAHTGMPVRLSATIKDVTGDNVVVDSTIPATTIKWIHKWSNCGINPTVVCFDVKGSGRIRKGYFDRESKNFESKDMSYKGSRSSGTDQLFTGINLTANFLHAGGVGCCRMEGYEADDLIFACVLKAKEQYPGLPIHVITGDLDLVPLVDDQVSVFVRSTSTTYAEDKKYEKVKYVQVTPRNFKEFIMSRSDRTLKNLNVEYNTLLLAKILRGDPSDELPGKPDWKPKTWNTLMELLLNDGHDLSNLCRYGACEPYVCYRSTGLPVPLDLISSTPTSQMVTRFRDPVELDHTCDVLSKYVEQEDIDYIRYKYRGMNLNGAIIGTSNVDSRVPIKLNAPIKGYIDSVLQQQVDVLRIHL